METAVKFRKVKLNLLLEHKGKTVRSRANTTNTAENITGLL